MGCILVLFWGPFLAALGLERLLCRVTRRRLRPLRLAPLLGLAAPLAGAWRDWDSGLLWQMAIAMWVMAAAAILLGWWCGWRLGRTEESPGGERREHHET